MRRCNALLGCVVFEAVWFGMVLCRIVLYCVVLSVLYGVMLCRVVSYCVVLCCDVM